MRVLIQRPNGYRGVDGIDAKCGESVELPDAVAADLISAGWAVAVGVSPAAPSPAADEVAPVEVAARNGVAKKWKKKG